MIVDLAKARAFALTLRCTDEEVQASLLIEDLADEVESLERALVAMRADYDVMRMRARHVVEHNRHPEATATALRILGRTAAPVAARQQRAAKLRADAKYWTGVAAEEIDGEKKAMAEELARSLSEQAKEVDL